MKPRQNNLKTDLGQIIGDLKNPNIPKRELRNPIVYRHKTRGIAISLGFMILNATGDSTVYSQFNLWEKQIILTKIQIYK